MPKTNFIFFILAMSCFSTGGHAYIPELKTILSRTAENHGRGLYFFEQDVIFPSSPEPLIIRESWVIRDEGNMRVTLEGQGVLKGVVQGTIVYENGQKSFLDPSGSLRQMRISEQWAEPVFNFRNSKNYRAKLAALHVIPSDLLKDRAPFLKGPQTYTPPHHLRLSRAGGVVNYAIGDPTPNGSKALPGLWIEQDQFHVRKIRFPDRSTVLADQFQRFDQNLWLPKVRSLSWNNSTAQIQVMEVHSVGKNTPEQNLMLQAKNLNGRASPLKLTDTAGIQDFYSRFR